MAVVRKLRKVFMTVIRGLRKSRKVFMRLIHRLCPSHKVFMTAIRRLCPSHKVFMRLIRRLCPSHKVFMSPGPSISRRLSPFCARPRRFPGASRSLGDPDPDPPPFGAFPESAHPISRRLAPSGPADAGSPAVYCEHHHGRPLPERPLDERQRLLGLLARRRREAGLQLIAEGPPLLPPRPSPRHSSRRGFPRSMAPPRSQRTSAVWWRSSSVAYLTMA